MKFIQPVVIAFAVTTVVISCKSEPQEEVLDLQGKPMQTVAGMNAVQSKNAEVPMLVTLSPMVTLVQAEQL